MHFRHNSNKIIEMVWVFPYNDDNRWTKKIYQWARYNRKRRGRPQQSWNSQIMDFMRRRHMWRFRTDIAV